MAAVDALLLNLLDALISPLFRETYHGSYFVIYRDELELLASNLQSIGPALIDAEKRQLMEPHVKRWLNPLKSVIYECDDVLDEWNYQILESQFIKRNKVWSLSLLCPSFCLPMVTFRHGAAVKLNNLNKMLRDLATKKDEYGLFLTESCIEQAEWPTGIGASVVSISEVKGREVEKERIVNLLLAESSESLRCISIVGMGGIGKTTLVKLIYNDEMVKAHFDVRIWVCVSKMRIANAVIESPRQAMGTQQYIKGKRFLLVLDDVRRGGPNEWKELEDSLTGGLSGSRILVTSRVENVAEHVSCVDKHIIRVGLLSVEECWSLFSEIAFDCCSAEGRKNLEKIGGEIVAKYKGLPLAVKTIAGILRFRKSREWYSLGGELTELEEAQHGIFAPLGISYYDLSSSLKQCLLYCVIFPEGYRMSKDELISLWMAHGFLIPTEGRDMEMVGDDYFRILGMRYLFQDFEVEEKFNGLYKTYCKMHDLVHHLAQSVMGNECQNVDVDVEQVSENVEPIDLYHLYIKLPEKVEFPHQPYKLRKLRSLVVSPPKKDSLIGAALPKIFNELTCLRSLSLSRCQLENIPSNINKLIHLRWLKLSKNYALKELPETICKLYNLQTLSVNWCVDLIHFPIRVENLTNLRHLKNEYTYFLLPKGIGQLSGLRKLSRITIDPKFKDAFSLRDLKNLNNISGSVTIFFIERERDTLVEDAKEAQLKEKKHITALSLNFPERAAEEWMQQQDEQLVEALKPPPKLEVLRINSYAGANCPSWISTLTSLKILKLWYWNNCMHLPALAKLPCLEYIEFNGFGRVKELTAAFYWMDWVMEESSSTTPLFPKLTNLQFLNMIEWEEWNDYDGEEQVMPSLSYLRIENCPKLKALPNFIRKMATLHKQIS